MGAPLFSPITVGKMQIKNRTVMAPMVPNMAHEDGAVSDEFYNFYLARALGGVGYIVIGAAFVSADGRGFPRQLGLHQDELAPGLSRLTQAMGSHARVGVQLSFKTMGRPAETLSLGQIREYRKAFVAAAVRAKDSGFDAVELHACHDYLLNYFLSPYFNHRSDEYGGEFENRFRLLKEVTQDVLEAVGDSITVGVRLSMTDFLENGLDLDETLEASRRLEAMGVNYLSASSGVGVTHFRISPLYGVPRGSLLIYGKMLQQAVSIPVIGVGRLDRPDVFRDAVEKGCVSMAAAARAFIADPEYAAKIAEERYEDIRPCLACNFCLSCIQEGNPVRCAVNPFIGRDDLKPSPLKASRTVLVVGAGPAGLTAAEAAARRGAKVVLAEKKSRGGRGPSE